jgi:hypothetical protein
MSAPEAVVLAMWDSYDREGLTGVLRWAADDAVWRPHSSEQHVFHSTVCWTASSPDLSRRLAEVGLPGRANEAYMAMHRAEDVA